MGFMGGLLGTAGGANGTGFSGPESAGIKTPVSDAQAQQAYTNAQNGLNQQQAFVNAVNPGGLQALQSQQNLLGQLGQQAQGNGPNPALAQLNQTTGQNVANQAALMAGQRGSGANAGLIARQAAMQGANTQQNAVGQAATMRAQQQLAAQQQLGQQQQAMIGQQAGATNAYGQAAQNEQSNLLNSIAGVNNANVGMQSNVNNANASLAGISMQGQQNMVGGMMNTLSGSSLMGAEGGEVPGQDSVTSNGGVSAGSAPDIGSSNIPTISNAFQSKGGGGGGGIMKMLPMLAMLADGGQIAPMQQLTSQSGPSSSLGKYLTAPQAVNVAAPGNIDIGHVAIPTIANAFEQKGKPSQPKKTTDQTDAQAKQGYADADAMLGKGPEAEVPAGADLMSFMAAHGGGVPALLSPGERYLSPDKVDQVKKGASPMKEGEKVPGKPKVSGAKNSYANDTVKASLEEGGIVIPRSITQSKDAEKKSIEFVRKVLAKNHSLKKS